MASAIDFAPSVLNRAELAPYSGIQGEDIVSVATGKRSSDRNGLIIEADELPENVDIEKFFIHGFIRIWILIDALQRNQVKSVFLKIKCTIHLRLFT